MKKLSLVVLALLALLSATVPLLAKNPNRRSLRLSLLDALDVPIREVAALDPPTATCSRSGSYERTCSLSLKQPADEVTCREFGIEIFAGIVGKKRSKEERRFSSTSSSIVGESSGRAQSEIIFVTEESVRDTRVKVKCPDSRVELFHDGAKKTVKLSEWDRGTKQVVYQKTLGLERQESAAPAQESTDQDKVTKHLEAGEEALQGGKFEKAISAFKKADKVSGGSSVRALIGLATAHLELEHYQEVARVADQAHALAETSSDQAQLYYLVGSAYWGLAKEIIKKQQYEVIRDEEEATRLADLIIQAFAAAEDRFRKALELSEGDIEDSWYSLAWVLITQGRLAEGQAALEEYLEQVPEEERAQTALKKIKVARESRDAREKARALEEQDHLEEARAVLKGYLERHPVSIGVEFQLRRLDRMLEDGDESRCLRQIASYTSIGEISVTGSGFIRPLLKLEAPMPRFPQFSGRPGTPSLVVVRLVVDTKGRARCPVIITVHSERSDAAVLKALENWKYLPITVNGRPVAVGIQERLKLPTN